MVENDLIKESPLSAQAEVLGFLKRVWFHPLLNEETIKHREGFPEAFEGWCRLFKVDPNQTFGVLTGSSQWIIGEESDSDRASDYDFVLYGSVEAVAPFLNTYQNQRNKPKDISQTLGIEQVAVITPSEFLKRFIDFAPLLLTPDNFIAGNLELAAEYRKMLLEMKSPPWWDAEFYFAKYIKGWGRRGPDKLFFHRRTDRLERALERRAGQVVQRTGKEELNNKYQKAFKKRLREFELPSLEIYKQAIQETGGKFKLN